MTLAYIFPGQGSQTVGMGRDLADQYPEAKAVFEEVDDALGEKLSDIIFNGPEDALRLTANTQPALMAVSLAVVRVLEPRGFGPAEKASFVAGHSLGEYSALAAVGTLSVSDTARLLRIRGNAMQKAVPVGEGAMAAILGLDLAACEEIAAAAADGDVCEAANDNAPGQIVLSGSAAAIERAIGLAKERGAKRALPLPVSAPFHCALMQPAADVMADALKDAQMNAPALPVIQNVTARPTSDVEALRSGLVSQVTGRVRWSGSVSWFAENGGTGTVETGAGKVLTGLSKRIARSLTAQAVGDVAGITSLTGE